MTIVISFLINSFINSAEALKFIYPFITVNILAISSNKSFANGYDHFNLDHALYSLEENQDISFSLASEFDDFHEEKNHIFFRKDKQRFADLFWLRIENEENVRLTELIMAASKLKFTMACKFDFQKSQWQSEEFIANFNYFKRAHAHLPKIIDPDLPPILREKIDIFQNPGHQKLAYGIYLMAAPEMWFGPQSLNFFDKQDLLSFPFARQIEELVSNTIRIKLFDWDIPDYETKEILNLQRSFRNWVNMDEIELSLIKLMKTKRI